MAREKAAPFACGGTGPPWPNGGTGPSLIYVHLSSRAMADKESLAPPKRRWFKSEPMDEQGSRTMFVGLIIAFALYAVSFVVTAMYKQYVWANWVSIGLILTSVVFLGVWFLSVRGGFRLGKTKSRATRRAQMHAREEKEKRTRLNR